MNMRSRLSIAFLCCGLLPVVICGIVSYITSTNNLHELDVRTSEVLAERANETVVSVRDSTQIQIEDYFDSIKDELLTFATSISARDALKEFKSAYEEYAAETALTDEGAAREELLSFYKDQFLPELQKHDPAKRVKPESLLKSLSKNAVGLQLSFLKNNPNPLGSKQVLDQLEDDSTYSQVHQKHHPSIRYYVDRIGFYDVFLVDWETGNIVYTVFKETDFATSLQTGPHSTSHLGEAFRKVKANPEVDNWFSLTSPATYRHMNNQPHSLRHRSKKVTAISARRYSKSR